MDRQHEEVGGVSLRNRTRKRAADNKQEKKP